MGVLRSLLQRAATTSTAFQTGFDNACTAVRKYFEKKPLIFSERICR
jgi:hypothetical protein